MYCSRCGTQITDEGINYCPKCGLQVRAPETQQLIVHPPAQQAASAVSPDVPAKKSCLQRFAVPLIFGSMVFFVCVGLYIISANAPKTNTTNLANTPNKVPDSTGNKTIGGTSVVASVVPPPAFTSSAPTATEIPTARPVPQDTPDPLICPDRAKAQVFLNQLGTNIKDVTSAINRYTDNPSVAAARAASIDISVLRARIFNLEAPDCASHIKSLALAALDQVLGSMDDASLGGSGFTGNTEKGIAIFNQQLLPEMNRLIVLNRLR